jgi:hypothetical protein
MLLMEGTFTTAVYKPTTFLLELHFRMLIVYWHWYWFWLFDLYNNFWLFNWLSSLGFRANFFLSFLDELIKHFSLIVSRELEHKAVEIIGVVNLLSV